MTVAYQSMGPRVGVAPGTITMVVPQHPGMQARDDRATAHEVAGLGATALMVNQDTVPLAPQGYHLPTNWQQAAYRGYMPANTSWITPGFGGASWGGAPAPMGWVGPYGQRLLYDSGISGELGDVTDSGPITIGEIAKLLAVSLAIGATAAGAFYAADVKRPIVPGAIIAGGTFLIGLLLELLS